MKCSLLLFSTLLAIPALAAGPGGGPGKPGHGPGKPTPKKPLVKSNELRRLLTRSALLKHANKFEAFANASPGGNRAFGTKGHNATVDYIKSTLDKTGFYDTELQTFNYLFSEGTANFTANAEPYTTEWFTYGPGGTAEGLLVPVSDLGCEAGNFPAEVAGNIALIQRGTCEFGLKIALAGGAGASGAVLYNNAPEPINGGTLGSPERPEGPYVPASSISGADGQKLLALIAAGDVQGKIVVDALNEYRYTSNVLATTKTGDKNNLVFSGAHTDSVPQGAGINDNGSGTIGLLEVALALTKFSVKNAVKFGFWTAEEYGLVGAEHYVSSLSEEELAKIALYANHDMIASPNFGYFIYDGDGSAFNITGPDGSAQIEHLFEDYFKSVGIKTAPTEFDGRSDYGPFLDAGIPAGGLFTGAEKLKTEQEAQWWGGVAGESYDANYHQAGDDITNLNVGAWIQNTKAAAHLIATYARDLTGIPREKASVSRQRVVMDNSKPGHKRHAACNHEFNEI